jgi:hypothetical protein
MLISASITEKSRDSQGRNEGENWETGSEVKNLL